MILVKNPGSLQLVKNPFMTPAKPVLHRPNPFMVPATPALHRPNPFKMKATTGRFLRTTGGAAVGSALAVFSLYAFKDLEDIAPRWRIPVRALVFALAPTIPGSFGSVGAGFGGAVGYSLIAEVLGAVMSPDIARKVLAASSVAA